MAQFQFDASQHAAALNFDALPKGWYQGVVSESKSRTTSSGGQALDFVVELTAPPFAKGRKVFLGFNVVNSNPEAVRIGYEQLAAFSIACGHPKWNQTEELHNKPLHIKLKIEKAPEGSDYEDRNVANGYDPITVHRALAVQPGAVGSAPVSAPFPGGAPVAPPAAPVAAPTAPVTPAAPAVAAPVQPTSPVQQAAPAQPWTPPAQPTQPWEQPAAAAAPVAPVTQAPAPVAAEPVKSPEQIAWEAQQAALATQQQAPVAPVAPVQPEAPVAAQPAAATPPWATQTASPAPQQAAPAQAAAAPAEPPHPAQAQVPPWQQPQA